MWPLRPNAPGCFPTRVGIFLPPYLAALTALGKALLVTWLPTSCAAAGGLVEQHQSHNRHFPNSPYSLPPKELSRESTVRERWSVGH